jgi:DNA-binding NtrC family response regulator
LRDRTSDIPLLVDHYVQVFNEENRKSVEHFDDEAIELLQRYAWPGNVRELVNVVERSVVLARSPVVSASDLPEKIRQTNGYRTPLKADLAHGSLKAALADPERQLIVDALEAHGWNRQQTADSLGINRTTLYKKMKKHDIRYEKEHRYQDADAGS